MVVQALSVMIVLIFLALPSMAGDRRMHDHKAHEHGAANLNVSLEGQILEIELHAPGADIVGFEHAAETDKDRAAVAEALQVLREDANLFRPSEAAGCRISQTHSEYGKEEQDKLHESHREFEIHQTYNCQSPSRLEYIDVGLFEKFNSLKQIDVVVVGPRGQRGQELTPSDIRLKL